jgi:hypothetical protein
MNKNLTFEQLPTAVVQLYQKLTEIDAGLINLKNMITSSPQIDSLLNIQHAAEFLKVREAEMIDIVETGQIPVFLPNKHIYIAEHDLCIWLKHNRKKNIDEITGEADTFLQKFDRRRRSRNIHNRQWYYISEAAYLLNIENFGKPELLSFLKQRKMFMENNTPGLSYILGGEFSFRTLPLRKKSGIESINIPLISKVGIEFIHKLLTNEPE